MIVKDLKPKTAEKLKKSLEDKLSKYSQTPNPKNNTDVALSIALLKWEKVSSEEYFYLFEKYEVKYQTFLAELYRILTDNRNVFDIKSKESTDNTNKKKVLKKKKIEDSISYAIQILAETQQEKNTLV